MDNLHTIATNSFFFFFYFPLFPHVITQMNNTQWNSSIESRSLNMHLLRSKEEWRLPVNRWQLLYIYILYRSSSTMSARGELAATVWAVPAEERDSLCRFNTVISSSPSSLTAIQEAQEHSGVNFDYPCIKEIWFKPTTIQHQNEKHVCAKATSSK